MSATWLISILSPNSVVRKDKLELQRPDPLDVFQVSNRKSGFLI